MGTLQDTINNIEKYGTPIFKEMFSLNDAELKLKMKSICGNKVDESFFDNIRVTRIIVDEEPSEVKFEFYDALSVGVTGITFKPEHGSAIQLVDFNQHFKL